MMVVVYRYGVNERFGTNTTGWIPDAKYSGELFAIHFSQVRPERLCETMVDLNCGHSGRLRPFKVTKYYPKKHK